MQHPGSGTPLLDFLHICMIIRTITDMKDYLVLSLKGIAMGAANVIPGVSGGTVALIVGIFERLINSIKSFDLRAVRLLFSGKFKEFAAHIDLPFLVAVLAGIGISIISLARLFDYLFANYPVYIWSFFFGLILGSVYFVGKTVSKYTASVILLFIFGTAVAVLISTVNPAAENDSFFYLFICGVVAMCSMILPGLSGSFILVLMGNYELVMIDAVNEFNLRVLGTMGLGAGIGLLAFSHLLSWILKKVRDQTIALLTGFILGSLSILWPWKNTIFKTDELGEHILSRSGELIIQGYERYIPATFDTHVMIAMGLMISGIIAIWALEKFAESK